MSSTTAREVSLLKVRDRKLNSTTRKRCMAMLVLASLASDEVTSLPYDRNHFDAMTSVGKEELRTHTSINAKFFHSRDLRIFLLWPPF